MIQATHGLKMKLRKMKYDRNDMTVAFKEIYKCSKGRGLFLFVLGHISLSGDVSDAMDIKSDFFGMLCIDCCAMGSDV